MMTCYFLQVTGHTVVCSLHFEKDIMETFGFSKRTYLKPGAVPTKFECWENKVHLHKIDKRRKKNTLQQKRIENRVLNDSYDKGVEQCISENQPVILSHLIKSECTENQTVNFSHLIKSECTENQTVNLSHLIKSECTENQTVSLSNWIKSECESLTQGDSENESKHALQEHVQFLQKMQIKLLVRMKK